MSDRGMKKWAPYKALVEQEEAINKARSKEEFVEKPILSEDQMEEINNILVNYAGEILEIKIYKNKHIYRFVSKIHNIDVYEKKLIIEDRRAIYFKDLVSIKRI